MNFTLLSRSKLPFWEILLILYLFAVYLIPSFALGPITLFLLLLAYCVYIVLIDQEMFLTVATPLVLIALLTLAYALLTNMTTISATATNRETKVLVSTFLQYLSLYFPAILFIRINRIATPTQKKIFAFAGIEYLRWL